MNNNPSFYRISGAWTKAGVMSCLYLQGIEPKDNLLLDCGRYEELTYGAKNILITHGHVDHVGGTITHARSKALTNVIANYYVPVEVVSPLNEARQAFEKLDMKSIPMNMVGISPGDTFKLTPNVDVRVFKTIHRVPSQGYAIYYKIRGKLKSEYQFHNSNTIKQLKDQGINTFDEDRTVLDVVYTGDTLMEGLLIDENSYIFHANTFIMELTYLDGNYSKAIEYGHMHIQDIIQNYQRFEFVQKLIFVHVSARYSMSKIIEILRNSLPSPLITKCYVNLKLFGADEMISSLVNPQWHSEISRQIGWGWANQPYQRQSTSMNHTGHSSSDQLITNNTTSVGNGVDKRIKSQEMLNQNQSIKNQNQSNDKSSK